tara:strand:- start:454 stop:1416 length:963 start_codon:yes stop_codon:yes gene_type:complete
VSEVKLFKELTTEEALAGIEAESQKYDGLYVDMADSKQRKYVKDKAVAINGILKKLDRSRIDKAKIYKVEIELEAGSIKARLEAANKPFTLLIDGYNEERAKVLAEEKRVNEAKLAEIQYIRDYDEAVNLDRLFDLEAKEAILIKAEEARAIEERERLIAENAATKAREDAAQLIIKQQQESEAREAASKQALIDAEARAVQAKADAEADAEAWAALAKREAEAKARREAEQAELRIKHQAEKAELEKQAAINTEIARQEAEKKAEAEALAKREANKANCKKVNNAAMQCFINGGLSEESAKLAVTLIAKKSITDVQINY